ncbi:MAG TPA: diphosphate--fructose-6-phosphate 1-phosphotransferase [Chloroflexota bacterium]|jgi:6-phosphofructokinase|nr:diphosphate--fructose-6-phosphate 1-phosphotransferase [Chloroflexota bacterium]
MTVTNRLAILCGGGPAPGLNSVIGAATIRAALDGIEVLGIPNGFQDLMRGELGHVRQLTIEEVSRIHFSGGSIIGISRANPTKDPRLLETTTSSLEELGVDKLITIGGDDTAFSAMKLAEHSHGRLRVAHVPKTIDNDLDLPHGIATFGYQTARHYGVEIVKNLMTDARTTGKWFLILTMGRTAGHLALGIGKAAGATLTIIPEEFDRSSLRLDHLVDILAGAVIKRAATGHLDGTAVLAEGLIERLDPHDLESFDSIERDEHGHLRLAEINLGEILRVRLRRRLAEFNLTPSLVVKDIGYELRCADPIPFDLEYTRDLGYCAAKFLLEGGSNAMVTIQNGHFVPISFAQMLDPETGRTRVRLVDIDSEQYKIARRYMVRLRRDDFTDEIALARLAAVAGCDPATFRERFAYLVENEAPPLSLPLV